MARSAAHAKRDAEARNSFTDAEVARNNPSTKEIIKSECQRLGVKLRVEEIPESNGARIHWVGETPTKTVVLYFHGGGYAFHAIPGHVSFWIEAQRKLADQGKPFAVAMLEYGLTPEHKFPSPIAQSIHALNHILLSGRKPSDVIIGGDSAGGNLALGVLSAAQHSHASLPAPKLDTPLKGALLISPWVSYQTTSKSFRENQKYDIVPPNLGRVLLDAYQSSPEDNRDPFFEPALGDCKWWVGAPVDSILNLVGSHELLYDDLKTFGRVLEQAGLNSQTVRCEQQVHIDAILDTMSGLEPGPMSFAIWDWLNTLL